MTVLDVRCRYKASCACIGHEKTCYSHDLWSMAFESIPSDNDSAKV